MESGWLTSGPNVRKFESRFAKTVGVEHAVAVNSCTAALHVALAACGVGPGDDVIVPTMTFAATAEVVVHLGAAPILVDVDPDTLSIDPNLAAEAITDRTRAIIPVHYGGHPADLSQILDIATSAEMFVIEDAAHAFPASYQGSPIGGIGDVTCFSFYATKTITTGEGGMITTSDAGLASTMRSLSLHGLSDDAWSRHSPGAAWDYAIVRAGYKYNLTDMAAALGLSQLDRAIEFRDQRAAIADQYDDQFAGVPEIRPLVVRDRAGHAWHLYVIRLATDGLTIDRNQFIQVLNAEGIGTSVHYRPLHLHPYYSERIDQSKRYPHATRAFAEIISLPIFPGMTETMVDRVASTVVDIAVNHRR
ncbi:MAG: DegT/DnrJ/EryC1/StrS family aminotransferase [Acidimicrobiia bacterium]|nr:DegT/DnrJ/EryC1/StrS family aminotransferase [Acidimicrobiia bacterium]